MFLQLSGLSKQFGSLVVTDNINLDVQQGQALGILGPNGAGKSTLFNLITGNLNPDAGTVLFEGKDVTSMPAHQRCGLGIGRSFQIPKPFEEMTVFENLLVAASFGGGMASKAAEDCSVEVLQQTGLLKRANLPAGKLTLLERKRLELARAMATRPKMLLLDEIAGGLTEAECTSLVELIGQLNKEHGITVVWIEHVVNALLQVVDELFVIDFGRELARGEPQSVMNNLEVQAVYMGVDA